MPKKKPSRAPSAKPKKRDRANSLDLADLRKYFDEVHDLTDKMESSNARTRQNIGKVYERASADLKLTKKAIAKAFRRERSQLKEEAQMQETGTADDKASLLQIAAAFTDDTAMGRWAAALAAEITDEEAEAEEREPVGGAAERVATVHALRQPG